MSTPGPVRFELDGGIAVVTMDDGKVNVLSLQMLGAIRDALDRAAEAQVPVVVAGREGRFSGGFDLEVIRSGSIETLDMLRAGFELSERMLSFPTPVVVACTGHAIAMGVFTVLSGDYRIGADGPFRLTANEVAIGMTLPRAALEICRQRLTPAHFNRATLLAEVYSPADAVTAGFLDRVVAPEEVVDAARETAHAFAQLDLRAHAATKLRAREQMLTALRAAIEQDDAELRASV